MSCLYGVVVSQRNWRGAFSDSVPRLVLVLPLFASLTCCSKFAETEIRPLENASRRARAVSAADAAPATRLNNSEAKAETRMIRGPGKRRGKYPQTWLNAANTADEAQSSGGGGASTSRLPLCCGALTMPCASIISIRRAARL